MSGKDEEARCRQLLNEAYTYPKNHPEALEFLKNREQHAWEYGNRPGQGYDEFGPAFWTLQLICLKSVLRKAIEDCSKGKKARGLLEEILDLLETSKVNREPLSCNQMQADEFLDKAYDLAFDARDALQQELYNDWGFAALDLFFAYINCIENGIFFDFGYE